MKRLLERNRRRKRRKMRVRRKISGSAARPRLSVFKSNRHIYVQAIDDESGTTVAAVSSVQGDTRGLNVRVDDAAKLGQALGEKMKADSIKEAVFDRNGYLYHGVVKAVAEGARKAGVKL